LTARVDLAIDATGFVISLTELAPEVGGFDYATE
jgi:hypothetical protein